jgi:hypothetical protein
MVGGEILASNGFQYQNHSYQHWRNAATGLAQYAQENNQ